MPPYLKVTRLYEKSDMAADSFIEQLLIVLSHVWDCRALVRVGINSICQALFRTRQNVFRIVLEKGNTPRFYFRTELFSSYFETSCVYISFPAKGTRKPSCVTSWHSRAFILLSFLSPACQTWADRSKQI